MGKPDKNAPTDEVLPDLFLVGAKEFAIAAHILLNHRRSEPMMRNLDPLYFLTAHSIELSFKAYLRGRGLTTAELRKPQSYGHNLVKLYRKCKEQGLMVRAEKDKSYQQLVDVLALSDVGQGLRYYASKNIEYPTPTWCVEVADEIAGLVSKIVRPKRAIKRTHGGAKILVSATKLEVIYDKPTPTGPSTA